MAAIFIYRLSNMAAIFIYRLSNMAAIFIYRLSNMAAAILESINCIYRCSLLLHLEKSLY